jgi:hypothetical protein
VVTGSGAVLARPPGQLVNLLPHLSAPFHAEVEREGRFDRLRPASPARFGAVGGAAVPGVLAPAELIEVRAADAA